MRKKTKNKEGKERERDGKNKGTKDENTTKNSTNWALICERIIYGSIYLSMYVCISEPVRIPYAYLNYAIYGCMWQCLDLYDETKISEKRNTYIL